MRRTLLPSLLAFLTLAVSTAWADDFKADNVWVRPTAPGQNVAGMYMDLTADADLTLVAGESPAAQTVELHTMRMDNGVMVMRQLPGIDLEKGKTVSLKPGGLHVMLIGLKAQVKPGDRVPLTLVARTKAGKEIRHATVAEARMAPTSGTPMPQHHHHH